MKKKLSVLFARFISLMLIAAVSLTLVSCTDKEAETPKVSSETSSVSENVSEASGVSENTSSDEFTVGQGATQFIFKAILLDGTEKNYTVNTDKTVLGDALIEAELISGTEGAYGLYVDTVCGEYHKWEDDGKYWALYIDGEYAMTGIDSTAIKSGKTYVLKAE